MMSSPDFEDESPLTADGQNHSLNEETIAQTPVPMAASTAGRQLVKDARYVDVFGGRGSYISEDSSTTMSAQLEDDCGFVRMRSLHSTEPPGSSDNEGGQQSTERSSLGILPIDIMSGLSASILELDPSPGQVPSHNKVALLSPLQAGNESTASDADTVKAEDLLPQRIQSSDGNTQQGSKLLRPKLPSQKVAYQDLDMTPLDQNAAMDSYQQTPFPATHGAQQTPYPASLGATPQIGDSAGDDFCGGRSMAGFATGMLFGGQDADASIHEVKFADSELELIDDEFSDIGEYDNTMTEEGSPMRPLQPTEEPDGITSNIFGTVSSKDANLFETPHPPDFDEISGFSANVCDSGTDDVDINKKGVKGQSQLVRADAEGQVTRDDASFPGFHQPGQQSRRPHAVDEQSLRHAVNAGRESQGPGFERADNQGEGQEEEATPRSRQKLDSMYLRNDPRSVSEDTQDGLDISLNTNNSILFDVPCDDAYEAAAAASLESKNSSEIDTDDEVEAVRRELRAAFVRMDEQQEQRPADLEGSTLPPEEAIRQSAEGVAGAPVHTDGDGQDDSATGQSLLGTPVPPSSQRPDAPGSTADSPTALHVIQGLGLGAFSHPQVRDDSNASRNDTLTADDTVNVTDVRRVHFAAVAETRERTLSGASDQDTVLAQDSTLKEAAEGNELDSMFFKPSKALASSQMSEASQAPGFEHSTFNLSDLCADGEESRQKAAGSEVSDEPIKSAHEKEKDADDVFASSRGPVDHQPEKKYVTSTSPVYITETGEGVTDLAFHVPLDKVAQNPFADESYDAPAGFSMAEGDFGDQAGMTFSSSEFKSGDEGKAMLDQDEKENAENEKFLQVSDEQMDASGLLHTGSSLGLPDSWSFHSHLHMSDRPSWLADEEAAYTRISVGTFMGSRTEALGSLDGDRGTPRPTFGSKIKTPPQDRRPVPLYQKTPPSTLRDIAEAKSSEEGTDRVQPPRDTGNLPSDEAIRSAGVGSDSENEALRDEPESEPRGIPQPHQNSRSNTSQLQIESDEDRPLTPEDLISDPPIRPDRQQSSRSSTSSGMANNNGGLNLSEITRLISSASASAKPQELTEMFFKMSQSKRGHTYDNEGRTEDKTAESQKHPRLPIRHVGSQPVKNSGNGDPPLEPRSAFTRIPADGKSDRRSAPAVKPSAGSPSATRRSAQSTRDSRLSKSRGSGSGESNITQASAASDTRISPRDGADDDTIGAKGRASERLKQTNVPAPSKIPTLRRQSSNESAGRKNSAERKPSTGREHRPRSDSREKRDNTTAEPRSRDRDKKPASKVYESEQRSTKPSRPKVTDNCEDSTQGPTTPKHLVLRERNNTSFGSPGNRDIGNQPSPREGDSIWKSPRPSSIVARSQRRENDLDMSSNFYTSDMERPAEPDGENVRSPNQAKSVMFTPSDRPERPGIPRHVLEDTGPRSRLSSTPNKDEQNTDFTFNSQYFLSQIGCYPKDGPSGGYDGNSTTTSDQSGGSDKQVCGSVEQSTPKAPSKTKHAERSPPIEPQSLAPRGGVLRSTLPTEVQEKPTLLTNQRLAQTAFASVYLDGKTSSGAQRDGWMTATAPGTNANNNHVGHLPNGAATTTSGHMTSFSVDDVSIRVASELRFRENCCVGLSAHSTLTLQNPTTKWLHVVLKLVALSIDGVSVDVASTMPFVMKEKVIVEPSRQEEVKVIFAPRHVGVYVAQLHVVASPVVSDLPLLPDRVPAVVTLQAIAEKPHVQIVTPSQSQLLDFGAIPWGCHKGLPIAVINHSRAAVPVRLVIASNKNSTLWSPYTNCFTFERYTTGDISSISNKSRPNIPSLSPSVVNYTLEPCGPNREITPVQIMVYFVAPPKHMDRNSTGPPEDFTARIALEVDSPSSLMKLSSVVLRATAGTARLHAPRDLECVQLSAEVGKFQTQVIPLRNAGNITIDVTLEITHYQDLFSPIPAQLQIEPGGQSEVTVKFQPKESCMDKLNSLLLMSVEPDGPSYEVQLEGQVTSPEYRSAKKPTRGPQLLSNKSLLAWGGVPLGRARQQSLTLKNVAEQMLKLRLDVKASHDNFQLQSLFGKKERLSLSKEILMKPLETFPVHVLFAPTKIKGLEAKLQIRVVNSTVKYTIPMYGYGGISKLVMENVQKGQNNNYWITVGSPRSNITSLVKATVRNVGSRAAYVKCLGFSDLGCKKQIPSARLTMQPEELCIQANESREVRIILQPTDKDVIQCSEGPSIIGAIAFLYGDEVTRQQLRRSIQKYGKGCMKVPDNSVVKDVLFHVPFEDEENVSEGDGVKDTPSDVEIFYNTMSKMMLALVGEPESPEPTIPARHPAQPLVQVSTLSKPLTSLSVNQPLTSQHSNSLPSQHSGQRTSKSLGYVAPLSTTSNISSVNFNTRLSKEGLDSKLDGHKISDIERSATPTNQTESVKNVGHSPPVRDDSTKQPLPKTYPAPITSVSGSLNSWTDGSGRISGDWSIQPETVVLPAPDPNSEPLIKRIQLNNYSERSLKYDLSWPAHCIAVRPEQGIVAPRSSAVLCISANSLLHAKGVLLPWAGHVHLTCDGQHQVVNVQIREGLESEDSLLLTGGTGLSSFNPLTPATPMVSVATPVHPAVKSLTQSKTPTQQLVFNETPVEKTTEAFMEVTNTSAFPVKWHLSSFTPPYLKCARTSDDVLRVTYSVYWLPRHAGIVQPGDREKIQICFQPREVGTYAQHWELKTEAQGVPLSATQRTKYEFLAEAKANPEAGNPPGISWADVITENTNATSAHSKTGREVKGKEVVEVKTERAVFPTTTRRESHTCKVEFKNKSCQSHQVTIQRPDPPFCTQHHRITMKPRHYVRVPVEFKPKKVGHYQGVLLVKVDTGQTLTVPLIGQCVE